MLLSVFCHSTSHAESKVFRSVTSSVTIDKSCKEKPDHFEIMLVFDGEPETASSGWFYGKGTMTAEFKSISPAQYDVTYSSPKFHKLPPSKMELHPSKDGYRAVLRDHTPEDKKIRDSACFFEKLEVDLVPAKELSDSIKMQAKDVFSAEVMILEGYSLIFDKSEYRAAETKGHEALSILERTLGKTSEQTLDAAAVIAFALMYLERFDEALAVIEPYRKALPERPDLKELEELLQKGKKKQDDLFRYDPGSESDVDLAPLG